MSAPVDVLAVLRRHAGMADLVSCDAQRAEAHEVLAAVAELIEQRDTLLNALKRALPRVEHACHTHEDFDGSFWIDVAVCRAALARVQGVKS